MTSHAMRWLPDRVEYRVWRGGPDDESPANMIHAWTYTGPHIPRPEQPRMHLNLWKLDGTPASGPGSDLPGLHLRPGGRGFRGGRQARAASRRARPAGFIPPRRTRSIPRPRSASTWSAAGSSGWTSTIWTAAACGPSSSGYLTAGEHEATWDGRDDGGRHAGLGVYLLRLRGEDFVETRRVALSSDSGMPFPSFFGPGLRLGAFSRPRLDDWDAGRLG